MSRVFKCEGDLLEQIPEEIMVQTGICFPVAHENGLLMAILAKSLKGHRGDVFCRVPFCVTVEAEAWGAQVKLGDEKFGPRVETYTYKTLEAMADLPPLDFSQGRIAEVLKSVTDLSHQGESVILNVEGPFTILSSLIDQATFYKAVRKDRALVDKVVEQIANGVFDFILKGIQSGARVISYGDPMGVMELVGPKVYGDLVGPVTYDLLRRVEQYLSVNNLSAIIHLCGKTSVSLENAGLCHLKAVPVRTGITYGQALREELDKTKGSNKSKRSKWMGNACIKRTPLKIKDDQIWEIEWL